MLCFNRIQHHVTRLKSNFFNNNGIVVLDWPGNSPDMNPIENLWAICKKRLTKYNCTTKQKVIEAIIQVWFHDNEVKEMCKTLAETYPAGYKSLWRTYKILITFVFYYICILLCISKLGISIFSLYLQFKPFS